MKRFFLGLAWFMWSVVQGATPLRSATFKGVGPGGFDLYEVKFESGSLDWRILLDAEGKVAAEGLRPIP